MANGNMLSTEKYRHLKLARRGTYVHVCGVCVYGYIMYVCMCMCTVLQWLASSYVYL